MQNFDLLYDPIAYFSNKCYEQYEIINILPENIEIENIEVETEGLEIIQYSENGLKFIGRAIRKHSLKIIITLTSYGQKLTKEFFQKVSLKKCCD